jgi:hypothetical protein
MGLSCPFPTSRLCPFSREEPVFLRKRAGVSEQAGRPEAFRSALCRSAFIFAPGRLFGFPLSKSTSVQFVLQRRPVMRVPEHPTLIRRMLDSRLKKLATTTPLLAAALNA